MQPSLGATAVFARPARLPAPGALTHWMLERPGPAAGALVVIAIALFVLANRRGRPRAGALRGGIVLALGALVYGAGALVTTAREAALRASRALVASVSVGDEVALDWLLAKDLRLSVDGVTSARVDKGMILRAAVGLAESGLVEHHALLANEGAVDGPGVARTQIQVRSDTAQGLPAFAWWMVHWRRDPDGEWRATRLDWLTLNGRAPGEAIVLEIERAGSGGVSD